MKPHFKSVVSLSLLLISFVLSACSGPVGSGSGSGSGGGPFTISVTVSGLAGTGLVLADNTTDKLTITVNGTSAFASTVAKGGSYAVTVQTQPSNPTQTCAGSRADPASEHRAGEARRQHLHQAPDCQRAEPLLA